MGGSLGMSKSGSSNQAQFGQDVWGGQGGALTNMYNSLGSLFNQTNQGMQNQIPGATQNMQGIFDSAQRPWEQQLQGGAYAGMDTQGNYDRALQGGGNEQFMNEQIMGGAGNNYADAMKMQLEDDSSERLGRSLAGNDARAAGYGQSGGSRHGITESRLYDQSNRDLAQQQTNVGFNTFDKDLDRKLGIARNADQFDLARLNSTENVLNSQQGAMSGGIGMGNTMQGLNMGQFAPGMAPWEAANSYSNNMGDPTILGSGQSGGSSSSKGFGLSGGVGGGK